MGATFFIILCTCGIILSTSAQTMTPSPNSSDYEILVNERGINSLLRSYSGEIRQSLLKTTLPAVSSEGIDTQPSYFETFHHDDIQIQFNPQNQSIVLSIDHINGSIHSFDFVAKQPGIFTEVKCKGSTQPSFTDWKFLFLTKINIINECELQFAIDEDSVQIVVGSHDFAYTFEDPMCNSMVNIFEELFDLKEEVINDFVQQVPSLMIEIIEYELDRLLPSTHFFDTNALGGSQKGNQSLIWLCYKNVSIDEENNLFIGIDFMYDGFPVSDDGDASNSTSGSGTNTNTNRDVLLADYAVNGDISVEVWILIAIIVLGFLIGNCCTLCFLKCTGRLKGDSLCYNKEKAQEEVHVDHATLVDHGRKNKTKTLSVEMGKTHPYGEQVKSTSNLQDVTTPRDSDDDPVLDDEFPETAHSMANTTVAV